MINILNKNKVYKSRFGFTLAEILITLGVIGVISAITIPSIIASYKHKVLEIKFKTAYSILSNAVRQISIDNPDLYNDMYNEGNSKAYYVLGPLLKSKLKVIEEHKSNGYNFSINYKNFYNTNALSNLFGVFGYFMTSNGMIIYPECSDDCKFIHIFVDINGNKAPNRAGHDLFDFEINDKNQLVPSVQFGTSCNKKGASAGFDCTSQALYDKNYFKNLPR